MKTAILVHSDANAGEEALGRVFNALALAHDLKARGDEVKILFLGTGTRWIAELAKPNNPVHGLFNLVKDKVEGASLACSVVFGSNQEIQSSEFALLNSNAIPGTDGLAGVARLMHEGYGVLVY